MSKTLTELHKDFLEYAEFTRQVSPETLRGYRGSLAILLRCFPDLTVEELTSERMHDFFKWLRTRQRRVGRKGIATGVKKSTVATYWRKLSKFFDWLHVRSVIQANPLKSRAMEFPSVRYDDKKYLGRKTVEQLLVAIAFSIPWGTNFVRHRNLAMISVALNCGIRRGELMGLKLTDVDLGKNRLFIRSETSKSRRERVIPLNSRVRRDIEDYIQERRARRYMIASLWVSDTQDAPLTVDGLRHVVGTICRQSGVKFHMHQLRHTFAVNFLHNSGHNSYTLQALLGHRSISSTAIYTRCLPPQMMEEDIERLANLGNAV
jgi:integrase/recombinase XerD